MYAVRNGAQKEIFCYIRVLLKFTLIKMWINVLAQLMNKYQYLKAVNHLSIMREESSLFSPCSDILEVRNIALFYSLFFLKASGQP